MSFDALLDEIETMTKALPSDAGEDDQKIQAAADESDEGADAGDADREEGDDAGDEGGEGEELMGKSMRVTLEDGTEAEAIDGTELVKSLMARVEKNEGTIEQALKSTLSLVKAQGDMIKSMQDKITKLSAEGRGRKSTVTVTEKPSATMAKSEQPEGMPAQEFMAKALRAQADGRITGHDVSRAESYLNKGLAVPQDIVTKVIQ